MRSLPCRRPMSPCARHSSRGPCSRERAACMTRAIPQPTVEDDALILAPQRRHHSDSHPAVPDGFVRQLTQASIGSVSGIGANARRHGPPWRPHGHTHCCAMRPWGRPSPGGAPEACDFSGMIVDGVRRSAMLRLALRARRGHARDRCRSADSEPPSCFMATKSV